MKPFGPFQPFKKGYFICQLDVHHQGQDENIFRLHTLFKHRQIYFKFNKKKQNKTKPKHSSNKRIVSNYCPLMANVAAGACIYQNGNKLLCHNEFTISLKTWLNILV